MVRWFMVSGGLLYFNFQSPTSRLQLAMPSGDGVKSPDSPSFEVSSPTSPYLSPQSPTGGVILPVSCILFLQSITLLRRHTNVKRVIKKAH